MRLNVLTVRNVFPNTESDQQSCNYIRCDSSDPAEAASTHLIRTGRLQFEEYRQIQVCGDRRGQAIGNIDCRKDYAKLIHFR